MIQFLVPVITHSSPSGVAVVAMLRGSEPASGSDSANAGTHSPVAQRGRMRARSSSDPNSAIGSVPSSCTMSISALDAQALAISSIAMLSISVPVPVPPYSSANGSARMSWSASSRRMSQGYSAARSMSAARGAMRSVTSWRMPASSSRFSAGIA